MNKVTKEFVKGLFIKQIGSIPKDSEAHKVMSYEHLILAELCEALDIYVDSDKNQ